MGWDPKALFNFFNFLIVFPRKLFPSVPVGIPILRLSIPVEKRRVGVMDVRSTCTYLCYVILRSVECGVGVMAVGMYVCWF